MTLRCPECRCVDVHLIDSNGAQYPRTRWELYRCVDCAREFRKVLTA